MLPHERSRLAHDVGKYIARAARNLKEELDPAVVAMMIHDLYELEPGRRASTVFDRLAPSRLSEALAAVRALLSEIDRLEHQVRAQEPRAVRRAAELARLVEDGLRRHQREAGR